MWGEGGGGGGVFFFNDTATTEIYTLSLHDALPIWTIDRILWVAGILLGVIAILCGGAAYIRRESRAVAGWATGLGVAAISLQFVSSALMIIIGAMVLCALIYALGDLLSFG